MDNVTSRDGGLFSSHINHTTHPSTNLFSMMASSLPDEKTSPKPAKKRAVIEVVEEVGKGLEDSATITRLTSTEKESGTVAYMYAHTVHIPCATVSPIQYSCVLYAILRLLYVYMCYIYSLKHVFCSFIMKFNTF